MQAAFSSGSHSIGCHRRQPRNFSRHFFINSVMLRLIDLPSLTCDHFEAISFQTIKILEYDSNPVNLI